MKIQLKTLFSLIIVSISLLPLLTIPNFALADGVVIRPDPYLARWDYLNESNQQAFINYEDGLEKMILSIGMEETSESAVWIFPVPAEPNKVVIDVVTQFPKLNGEEISKKAKSNLFDIKKALLTTQIYTIPFIDWLEMGTYKSSGEGMMGASLGIRRAIETDVIVHEHLEKEGITTEIITAKTAQALYQYLQNKNLKIEEGSIPVLDHYIGKEFTFVVSWISETNIALPETQSKQRGVFVTFPTQEIYYPLLPTSVYGSKIIPVTIRIIGHRSPKIFKDIKNYTKTEYFIINDYVSLAAELKSFYGDLTRTEYFINDYVSLAAELKSFYGDLTKSVKYTKIEIKAPSKFLTDDLWINPRVPFKTYYSSFVAQHALLSGILLLILSSIITCIIVGWIVFRDLRNKNGTLKLVVIGLSNCLSIIGLVITTALFRTKPKDEKVASLLNEIKQKGYVWKRRLAVILFFADLPFLTFGVMKLPSVIQLTVRYGFDMLLIINFYVIPLLVLALALFIKRIKTEDKSLFVQLESAGYSSWSFNPKDRMKFIFVPLFSVSFLALSWLVVKLVEFTV